MQVNIHHAKTHLSQLLARAASGEEIVIARAGKPVARLAPVKPTSISLGIDRGRFEVPENFDARLPPDVLASFYGGGPLLGRKRRSKSR